MTARTLNPRDRRFDPIRARKALAFTCVAALLAGGALAAPRGAPVVSPTSEAPKPLSITLLKLTHEIPFSGETVGVEGRQQADLDTFLASSEARPGDPAYVESNGSALGDARAANLAEQLTARGFATQVVRDTNVPPHELRVVLERYIVTAPICPDWSHVSWANFNNKTSSNFGCATSDNLAAMVADPRDLAVGRPLSPDSGEEASRPVARYRAGAVASPGGASASGGGGGGGSAGSGGP
ncbi:MAG TPA: CpaD family pilus assembly lipoprotein [Caulobacteraceae bacterium]|jgi:pilus assembly protein CpaD